MKKKKRQSTVVFLKDGGLPNRSDVVEALSTISPKVTWLEEHETAHTYALTVKLGDADISLAIVGAPLEAEMYQEMLDMSGLEAEDQDAIMRHGSHVRIVFMEQETPVEPVDRMALVYRVAACVYKLGGLAVLAPASGVFVLDLELEHIDKAMEEEIPPLDMWIAVEKIDDDVVRTAGASHVGLPDVEMEGVGMLEPEVVFTTMMDVMLYLRRIRRELIPGETLHVGQQPFQWLTMRGSKEVIHLRRTEFGPDDDA